MRKSRLSKFFASLATAGTIAMAGMLPFSSKAQSTQVLPGNEVITFGGNVSQVWGTGNGISNGSTVNGSITFSPSLLQLIAGNGSTTLASQYAESGAVINENINGVISTFYGLQIDVIHNMPDYLHNIPADTLQIQWGQGWNDDIAINYPTSPTSDSSINSLLAEISEGLNGSLQYSGEAVFNVGYDSSGNDGVSGNLTSFSDPISTPEPSTYGLGAAGLAALFGFQWRRFIPQKQLTEPFIKG